MSDSDVPRPRLTIWERRRRRQQFLQLLYDIVDADPASIVMFQEVGAEMGLDHGEAWDVRAYLGSQGYIQGVTGVGGISITFEGVRLVESWHAGPDPLHPEPQVGNTVNIGTAVNTQIQQGTTDSSQSMSVSHQTLEHVQGVVSELEKSLHALGLADDDRDEMKAQIDTAKGQLGSRKPRLEVVKGALASMKEILEGAAAAGAAATKVAGFAAAIGKALGMF